MISNMQERNANSGSSIIINGNGTSNFNFCGENQSTNRSNGFGETNHIRIDYHAAHLNNNNADETNVVKDFGKSFAERATVVASLNNNLPTFGSLKCEGVDAVHMHNYSKVQSSSEDYDMDDSGEHSPVEVGHDGHSGSSGIDEREAIGTVGTVCGGDDKAPDHHARRPMNAFLIFCKRHRGIVREKYPNLENRSITKILGDWWANLDKDEKLCYTSLAKQYKDAFFTANPNFKWYKLPAPPLRTLSMTTRPSHTERTSSFSSDSAIDYEFPNGDHGEAPYRSRNIEVNGHAKYKPNVGMFKLADEAQMGGLNSLMIAAEQVNSKFGTLNNNLGESSEKRDGANALHQALGETTTFLERTMAGTNDNYSTIPRTHSFDGHFSSPDKSYEFDCEEDNGLKKSTRACKGKRYLEFMNARKQNPIVKKSKPRSISLSSTVSIPSNALPSPTTPKAQSRLTGNPIQRTEIELSDHLYASPPAKADQETLGDSSKLFDANDFDLEEKIKALPARSLEKYLKRKRDTKKKKKITSKRSTGDRGGASVSGGKVVVAVATKAPETIQEVKERMMMVGSQKRKARKESITRREIASISAHVENIMRNDDQDVAMRKPEERARGGDTAAVPDLLILATMAEAAANFGV